MVTKALWGSMLLNVLLIMFMIRIYDAHPHYKKPVRVYVDMVADLFHYGHVEFLKQAKQMGDYLIVGINDDSSVEMYKRRPIMTLDERIRSVKECKYVDEVISSSPIKVTYQFMHDHDIDLVVHGDDLTQAQIQEYYEFPHKIGKFKTIPYTNGVSTSNLINRIVAQYNKQPHNSLPVIPTESMPS